MSASDYKRCTRCRQWGWGVCACKEYTCWLEDGGEEDSSAIWAKGDSEVAAEAYLEYCHKERDGWEWIHEDSSHVVFVRDGDAVTRFSVNAYTRWVFSAHELRT